MMCLTDALVVHTYVYTYMHKGKDSLTHAPCLSLDIYCTYILTYIHILCTVTGQREYVVLRYLG